MDHYVKTKARLFKKEHGKICILPRDCAYFDIFAQQAGKDAITYSMKQAAHYQTRSLKTDGDGIDIVIKSSTPPEEGRITSKLVGVFNVDYAHTETSLRSVLETLRASMKNNKLVVVFWATGDRDTTKRPKMGAVVHELADIIVLTDDDTYTEPSGRIIDMVQKWIPRETGDTFQIIPDRKEAIHWAIRRAQKWDIVLIAGKWCETVQVTNKWPIPWSDRGIVEELLG